MLLLGITVRLQQVATFMQRLGRRKQHLRQSLLSLLWLSKVRRLTVTMTRITIHIMDTAVALDLV